MRTGIPLETLRDPGPNQGQGDIPVDQIYCDLDQPQQFRLSSKLSAKSNYSLSVHYMPGKSMVFLLIPTSTLQGNKHHLYK